MNFIFTGDVMKKFFLYSALIMVCSISQAGTYPQYKQQVRNELVKCLKDPENAKFSAAYNGCLLEASANFLKKANLEFNAAFQKANAVEKDNLLKDRKIYSLAFEKCEIFQDLSFDGFGKEAICKLQTAKDYLNLLTNGASSYPNSWTIENRIDRLFIGY